MKLGVAWPAIDAVVAITEWESAINPTRQDRVSRSVRAAHALGVNLADGPVKIGALRRPG